MVEEVKRLVGIVKECGVRQFLFKSEDVKISIKISKDIGQDIYFPDTSYNSGVKEEKNLDVNKVEIKSGYVGILRLSDKKGNLISVIGKEVSKGDVLCSIEVLGIEHKVESPVSGIITSILLNDGDVVGYGSLIMEITTNNG